MDARLRRRRILSIENADLVVDQMEFGYLGIMRSQSLAERQVESVGAFPSSDPDSSRIWWTDGGVHQNLTFPVQPDPLSGQHCWHQRVTISRPGPDDRYGDVVVDTNKSFAYYKEWLRMTRPAPGPGNLRRPLWLPRAFKPDASAYKLE